MVGWLGLEFKKKTNKQTLCARRKTKQKDKTIKFLSIQIDKEKFIWDEQNQRDLRLEKISDEDRKLIFETIIKVFEIKTVIPNTRINEYLKFAEDYLIIKLYKMSNYKQFDSFKDCLKSEIEENNNIKIRKISFNPKYIELFESYLNQIKDNTSHITLKFKQTLFFWKHLYISRKDIQHEKGEVKAIELNDLYKIINDCYFEESKDSIDKINESLKRVKLPYPNFDISESLPPIFKVEYYFDAVIDENNFSNFSSGEKQKIFTIHSLIYHIRNLNTVNRFYEEEKGKKIITGSQTNEIITYPNINIILDEIELYAHPEFQRSFVADFLKSLEYHNFNLNINIIFVTHSPFILSDIPKQNVLFLSDGKPKEFEKKTFGANITDLLIDSFFFSDTNGENKLLIGDFAKNKINETIKWLNLIKDERQKSIEEDYKYLESNKKEKAKHKSIIDLIDEPLIKTKLTEMYYEVFDKDYLIDKEKEYIVKRAKELGLSIIKE